MRCSRCLPEAAHVAGHHVLGNGAPLAGVELAAIEDIERYLPRRDADIADAAFEPDGAGRNFEDFANGLAAQLHRLGSAGEPEAGVNDVVARRQCEGRRRALVFFDEAEHPGGVRLRGVDPPDETSADCRRVAAITSRHG